MKRITFLFGILSSALIAQNTWPIEGIRDKTPSIHAFTHATIIPAPGQKLENATLVIRDGIIEAVGKDITIPKDAVLHDVKGMWIFPGLIDAFSDYGVKAATPGSGRFSDPPQPFTNKKGAYAWNQAVKPEFDVQSEFTPDPKKAGELRALGFTTVHAKSGDGIVRGTGAVVHLGELSPSEEILLGLATSNFSFDKGTSTQNNPGSLMGAIAILRQTFYDALWYKAAMDKAKTATEKPDANLSLDALNFQWSKKLPMIIEVNTTQDILRADKVGKEFGINFLIKTGGYDYERLDEIQKLGTNLVVPINFPAAYDVEDPDDARNVSLQDLKKWELAPSNLAMLSKKQIPFSITAAGLSDLKIFWANIQKAMTYGLSEAQALDALTLKPAKMLGVDKSIGSVEKGKQANFILASGNLFEKNSTVYENWIAGKKYEVTKIPSFDPRGTYEMSGDLKNTFSIKGSIGKYTGVFYFRDTLSVEMNINLTTDVMAFSLAGDSIGKKGTLRLKGLFDRGIITGVGSWPDGKEIVWAAKRTKPFESKSEDHSIKKDSSILSSITYPNMGFGLTSQPAQKTWLIKNATVWTNTEQGILENADVLVENGKIKSIGKNLTAGGATVVDGKGLHLTNGIIDEHSHIAISRGGNEGSQSVSAEVRIGDIIDAEDSDIYRQLAGGVTTSHILHGSANTIGGQTQLIKLRWGSSPEQMKFEGAPGFIKFALGENVKQSNWGDNNTTRYPQTRMGVEQVVRDEFQTAKEYKSLWDAYLKAGGEKSSMVPPRRDLELDAIVEIMDNKRFITCHSYVQSEITMLMRVADDMGFKVNTFTHILEGYKVADKMKAHGAAGSSFADWWAYKYEVIDAIPQNPGIMASQGVTVAINSDDSEMARRLNQEAAKSVKYTGMKEEDAWKMVTLNPAKMLHIDNRVGSIKAGNDADLVLWNNNPLSIYAKPLQTYIDGRLYFDVQSDRKAQEDVQFERQRLIQKMIVEKKGGSVTAKPAAKAKFRYECDTMDSDYNK